MIGAACILAVFLAALGWVLGVRAYRRPSTSKTIRLAGGSLFGIIVAGACWSTFSFEYLSGPNTRICGFPVPQIVFQRSNADAPWLDFVGWTLYGALPLNILLLGAAPVSMFALVVSLIRWRRRRSQQRPD